MYLISIVIFFFEEVAQEYFERAFEVYSSLCMTERAIVCKVR